MREVSFLRQNAGKWKKFEKLLEERNTDADTLAELFTQLTDDLSYARTYYPESKSVLYLNELTSVVHQKIYRNQKEKGSRFLTFWKEEIPLACYAARRQFLYSFIIFTVSVLMSILSQANDPDFARVILGDGYVNMTLENIRHGDPMGVYKSGSTEFSFFRIWVNNMTVMMREIFWGVFLGIYTVYSIFKNGMIIGTFQYIFYQQGLLLTSALVIWIHGTLEISALILAGGAGLNIGNSILFPKTYTRRQSLVNACFNTLKISVGLMLVITIAAFLEGFVTRHTEMPIWLSGLIIVSSLALIVWYFVVYPFFVNNSLKSGKVVSEEPLPSAL